MSVVSDGAALRLRHSHTHWQSQTLLHHLLTEKEIACAYTTERGGMRKGKEGGRREGREREREVEERVHFQVQGGGPTALRLWLCRTNE